MATSTSSKICSLELTYSKQLHVVTKSNASTSNGKILMFQFPFSIQPEKLLNRWARTYTMPTELKKIYQTSCSQIEKFSIKRTLTITVMKHYCSLSSHEWTNQCSLNRSGAEKQSHHYTIRDRYRCTSLIQVIQHNY